jgi:type IV secretion system protein VirD4
MNTYGQSKGRSGSYSTNWQLTGRELMTPDEVRLLDNRYAILFIRGERPVMDLKYNILRHPNIALTVDGGAQPYRHGEDLISIASVSLENIDPKSAEVLAAEKRDFLIFTEEEMEEMIKEKMEEKQYEEKKR